MVKRAKKRSILSIYSNRMYVVQMYFELCKDDNNISNILQSTYQVSILPNEIAEDSRYNNWKREGFNIRKAENYLAHRGGCTIVDENFDKSAK